MSLMALKCTMCGANINSSTLRCEHCGTPYIISNDTASLSAESEGLISDFNDLVVARNFVLAERIMQNLLSRFPQDHRVLSSSLRYELCQFDRKYEDKSIALTDLELEQYEFPENEATPRATAKGNEFMPVKNEHRYKRSNPNKKDFSALDEFITSIVSSPSFYQNKGNIGDFIIAIEKKPDGINGISYCYLGNDRIVRLPIISDDTRLKLNRVYIAGDERDITLIIPAGVELIETGAVSQCKRVKEIVIESKQISIHSNAFAGCQQLECIKIESKLQSLSQYAFSGCSSLHRIVYSYLAEGIDLRTIQMLNEIIEDTEYYGTSNILVLQICSAKTIPMNFFNSNRRITHIFTNTLVSINISQNKFALVIDKGVESLGERAFENCTSLQYVDIQNFQLSIGKHCFSGCKSLKEVKIKTSALEIEMYAFSGTKSDCEISLITPKNNTKLKKGWKLGARARVNFIS